MHDVITEFVHHMRQAWSVRDLQSELDLQIFDGSEGVETHVHGLLLDTVRSITVTKKFDHFDMPGIVNQLISEIGLDVHEVSAQGLKIEKYAMVIHQAPLPGCWRSIKYSKIIKVRPV